MLSDLASRHEIVPRTFQAASQVLGLDLWNIVSEGPVELLNATQQTQPAMLAAGVALWRVWCEQGEVPPASFMAGHSVGELAALVAAESLEFETAVALVADRARFMQEAVPQGQGAVAAVLGLDDDNVVAACEQAADATHVVAAVNFNSPGQVVIAGHTDAVERATQIASSLGAKRTVRLPLSVPVHCDLMRPAADRLRERLQAIRILPPKVPVVHNVDASCHTDPERIRALVAEQIFRPVRWADSIRFMAHKGAQGFVELGPGKVLSGLNRRIDRSLISAPVYDAASLESALRSFEPTTT
jgi:[acyl-carrier-protein] S-malonyltransferase